MGWAFLGGAILAEVAATLALRGIAGGGRIAGVVIVVAGYAVAFVLLAFALRTVNVGAAYAIWSGLGTAGVAVLAALIYGERISVLAGAGIVLVVGGVVAISLGGAAHG
jgi:small multidrug resistance pump